MILCLGVLCAIRTGVYREDGLIKLLQWTNVDFILMGPLVMPHVNPGSALLKGKIFKETFKIRILEETKSSYEMAPKSASLQKNLIVSTK